MKCFVITCNNKSEVDKDRSFHKFPKKISEQKEWLKVIGYPMDALILPCDVLCDEHFIQNDLIKGPERTKLRKGAIPEILYVPCDASTKDIIKQPEQSISEVSRKTHDNIIDYDEELDVVTAEIESIDIEIGILKKRRNELVEKQQKLKNSKQLQKSIELSSQNWHEEKFPWSSDVRKILVDIFKLTEFRSQQLSTINAIKSKKDVLLVAPTGGGKSLCFQLPAIISSGITIIISPLISLMEDQVWLLKKLNISAELLCSTTNKNQTNILIKKISERQTQTPLKLLYVTPERLAKSKRFMTALQKAYAAELLNCIAIDEVHCCSQWGHDFRTDYKFLGNLKILFPSVPILGVTATATSNVILDIQKMLNIQDCLVFKAQFNRPNLYYHVLDKPSEKQEVYGLLENLLKARYKNKSGIIYTFSIKDSEDICEELRRRNLNVRAYHANLSAEDRTKIHSKWLDGSVQAVIATVAFGMGINKLNVRFVIHHTISKSIENFYQESGRAGRDGERAECVLLYRFADMFKVSTMMFTEYTGLQNVYSIVQYAIEGSRCRRELLSHHFSEVWIDNDCNNMCDKCLCRRQLVDTIDLTAYCKTIYAIIEHCTSLNVKLTGLKLIEAWFHKGPIPQRLPNSKPPNFDRYYAEQIIAHLIINDYLKEDFVYTAYAAISYIKIGSKKISNNEIIFYKSSPLHLPSESKILSATKSAGSNNPDKLKPIKIVDVTETKKRKLEINLNESSKKILKESDNDISDQNLLRINNESVSIGSEFIEID